MKLKYYKYLKLYLVLYMLGNCTISVAQQNFSSSNNYIPSFENSPNVTQFNKYIDFSNISLNTGSLTTSIPVYTINQGNITIPISIDYSGNGVKVEQESSNIGLGWSLNYGGIVSRQINGIIDDFISFEEGCGGFISTGIKILNSINSNNIYHDCSFPSEIDMEADMFNYSIPNYSGKFVYDLNTNNFTQINPSLVRINPKYTNNLITEWEIIDPKGVKYIFGRNFVEKNNRKTQTNAGLLNEVEQPIGNSVWHINQIIDTNNDTISYTYKKNLIEYYKRIPRNINGSENQISTSIYTISYVEEHFVDSIKFKNGYVKFEYSNTPRLDLKNSQKLEGIKVYNKNSLIKSLLLKNEDYFDSTESNSAPFHSNINSKYINNRLKLDSLVFNFPNSEIYKFEYDTIKLPSKFSYAQDYWGYYNGEIENLSLNPSLIFKKPLNDELIYFNNDNERSANSNFSKASSLNKIVFPTGGYEEYIFEPNIGNRFNSLNILGISNQLSDKINNHNIKNSYNSNFIQLNTADRNECNSTSLNDRKIQFDCKINVNNSLQTLPILKDIEEFEISQNYYKKTCPPGSISTNYETFPELGGPPVCNYFPEGFFRSTGDKITINNYNEVQNEEIYFRVIFNGSIEILNNPNYNTNFEINLNLKENISNDYKVLGGLRVKRILSKDSDNSLLRIKEFNYNNKYLNGEEAFGETTLPTFGYYLGLIYYDNLNMDQNPIYIYLNSDNNTLPLNSTSITHYNYVEEILHDINSDEKYKTIYRFNNNLTTSSSIAITEPTNILRNINIVDNNFISSVHETKINNDRDDTLKQSLYNYYYDYKDIFLGLNTLDFSLSSINGRISFSHHIQKSTQFIHETSNKELINNQLSIQSKTNNVYSQNSPLLISKIKNTNSKGETITTEYKYPADLASNTNSIWDKMVERNMIATPVETKVSNNTTVLSEQRTKFNYYPGTGNNQLILPQYVYTKKGAMGTDVNNDDRKITYNSYDTQGNLTQYTVENGIPVSIIWGYNGQYPIAKIEGASFDLVSSFENDLKTASNSNSLTKTSFDALRNAFPNALVTGYIYKPLVGVTMIIQPNGISEHYKYDSANRLEEIKNDQGEVLKKFEYNYAQPQ